MTYLSRQAIQALHRGDPGTTDGPAALLIDGERRLLDVSAGGAALLDGAGILTSSFGRLVACHQGDMVGLEQAINTARWRGSGSASLDHDRLAVDIARMGAGRHYLLLARARVPSGGLMAEGTARRFGLTAAERRLLVHLLDGLALKEAAARLGVANTPARTHLQRIFDKTGVRRQTDLQRMVAVEARVGGLCSAPSPRNE